MTIIPDPFQIAHISYAQENPVSSRARDFRPARRRGFDDDNFEPPRRNVEPTPGFAAQRFEAPSRPPVRAVVKWYNPEKGFGFVQLADGSGDAFLHVSVVERSGHDSVPPGATLEVRAGSGPKGPQVAEVLEVDTSTAQVMSKAGRPSPRPSSPRPGAGPTEECLGSVKWYNVEKGFGFVAPGPRRQGRFVHATLDPSGSISGRVGDYEPRLVRLRIKQFIREMNLCRLSAED